MEQNAKQKFYTIKEAKEFLKIGHTQIYTLLNGGELKAVKMGGKTLILASSIEGFISSLEPYVSNAKQGG